MKAAEQRVICGDAIDTLSKLPSASVDLVHTSPPYNIDRPYQSGRSNRASAREYQDFLCAAINELKRVIKPSGSIFWQTGYTQSDTNRSEIAPIDLLSYELFHSGPNSLHLWDRIVVAALPNSEWFGVSDHSVFADWRRFLDDYANEANSDYAYSIPTLKRYLPLTSGGSLLGGGGGDNQLKRVCPFVGRAVAR